jgi:hypothetical protein
MPVCNWWVFLCSCWFRIFKENKMTMKKEESKHTTASPFDDDAESFKNDGEPSVCRSRSCHLRWELRRRALLMRQEAEIFLPYCPTFLPAYLARTTGYVSCEVDVIYLLLYPFRLDYLWANLIWIVLVLVREDAGISTEPTSQNQQAYTVRQLRQQDIQSNRNHASGTQRTHVCSSSKKTSKLHSEQISHLTKANATVIYVLPSFLQQVLPDTSSKKGTRWFNNQI